MKKYFLFLISLCSFTMVSAQDNMEAFRHLSVGAEAGLHGFGVEVAVPVQKHFVLKAGYNWVPGGDLFNTDININTSGLKSAQEELEQLPGVSFTNRFKDESTVNAGVRMGIHNYKVMLNWYPFTNGRLYVAGGAYYSTKDENMLELSGQTTQNDWAALNELNDKAEELPGGKKYDMEVEFGSQKYAISEKDGCGYMEAGFKIDPLKYYLGIGLGRCVPNRFMGLQFEVGALIYHNAVLTCQGQTVESIGDALEGSLSSDAKEIVEYVDKYPIYPQLTLRLSFRLF